MPNSLAFNKTSNPYMMNETSGSRENIGFISYFVRYGSYRPGQYTLVEGGFLGLHFRSNYAEGQIRRSQIKNRRKHLTRFFMRYF